MQTWCNLPCFHRTILVSPEGLEFLIIFCKFCRKAGFAAHSKFKKTIIDQETFESSIKYKCVATCSYCKREIVPFPVGHEALTLDFILAFHRPHNDLTEEEYDAELKINKPVDITTTTTLPVDSDSLTELTKDIPLYDQSF